MRQFAFSVAILAFSCQATLGNPTSPRPEDRIVSDTASAVFPDTENKSTLWVVPPTSGHASEPSLSIETAAAECESMDNLIQSAKSYSKQILTLARMRENTLSQLEAMDEKKSNEAIGYYEKSERISKLIINAKNEMDTLVAGSAQKHGGTLLIPYLNDIDQNITTIKAANPEYSDVRPVQTFNARMYFSAPGSAQDGVDLSLIPIIATYSVAGVKASELADSPAQVASRIDVTLSLTKMGACLMNYPQKFGVKTAPKFGMTVIYEYPFTFRTAARAEYNLKSIYKFLSESGTKGGLFTSKSWSRTVESNWGESSLKFFWSEDDPQSKITPQDRIEAERVIKADLLANIDRLILAGAGMPASGPQNPGPRGATVLASGLEKTCALNGYCAAAAIALRTLDAVFGSSSMSKEVEKRLDVTATYQMDTHTTRYVSQGISYGGN